jgi:hypothetical protein
MMHQHAADAAWLPTAVLYIWLRGNHGHWDEKSTFDFVGFESVHSRVYSEPARFICPFEAKKIKS